MLLMLFSSFQTHSLHKFQSYLVIKQIRILSLLFVVIIFYFIFFYFVVIRQSTIAKTWSFRYNHLMLVLYGEVRHRRQEVNFFPDSIYFVLRQSFSGSMQKAFFSTNFWYAYILLCHCRKALSSHDHSLLVIHLWRFQI